jgi:hypothetical protein
MKYLKLLLLPALLTALVSLTSRAAVIVQGEDKMVIGNVDFPTTVFWEVFVKNDDPQLMLSGFQVQVECDAPLSFYTAENAVDHPQLLAADPFIQIGSSTVSVIAAKLGSSEVPLTDGGGLVRIAVNIPADTFGNFPIRVISLEQDPDFGTALSGDANAPIPLPITVANGVLHVVPEPASLTLLAGMAALLIRRRGNA